MREMIVDLFAGGGGASLGIEQALGVPVDLAINHNALALETHRLNHPGTFHGCADVWSVDPKQATNGRPVGLLWASPDCTQFSKAKGGKPRKKNIRSLAWVVVRWAKAVRPRVILVENVEEFRMWGPLDENDKPCPRRLGDTYHLWCNQLRGLGYKLESRELRACDYGAPTIRKRLFIIARCDGQPIVWPEPTHGPDGELFGLKPYRSAAECIDWSISCRSIFERKKPLAEKTLARIARGIRKYVLDCGEPFIIKFRQGATGQSIAEPMHTITAGSYVKRPAGAGHAMGLCVPTLLAIDHSGAGGKSVWQGDEPLRTITQENRFALVSAFIDALVTASLTTPTAEGEESCPNPECARSAAEPQSKKDCVCPGKSVKDASLSLAAAHLVTNTSGHSGAAATDPVPTLTTGNQQYLVASHLTSLYGRSTGSDPREPLPTVTGGQHIGEVRAFLLKYYGCGVGQSCMNPMHTVTSKDRLGLVTIYGQDYQIVDIGLRMLKPRELARAQGFPDTYQFVGSQSAQVSMIGNSVAPDVARALAKANVKLRQIEQIAEGVA